MKYACKLDLPLGFTNNLRMGDWAARFSHIFNSYHVTNTDSLIPLLPKSVQDKKLGFFISRINFNGNVKQGPPHKHLIDFCVINLYLKTNGEETLFYEGEEIQAAYENTDITQYHQELSIEHLRKAESFVAKDNEAWLLNTRQPHSVVSIQKEGIRRMLQIYFYETPYEEVIELLKVENEKKQAHF